MEKEELEYIWNQIFKHLTKISYDDSIIFKGFRIEMMMNIQRFLSPNSVEIYEKNKQILNNARIKEGLNESEYPQYLERLKNELVILLKDMEYPSKSFNINKLEIMISLIHFLDLKKYNQNLKVLKNAEIQEHQIRKMLTIPTNRC